MTKLKFALYPNGLTPDPNDFTARLLDVPNYTFEDIVAICTRPGTGMTEEQIRGSYSIIEKAVQELSRTGTVTTSMFSTVYSVPGVYYDNDQGTANKYEVGVSMIPGASIQEAVRSIRLERVRAVPVQPEIDYITDMENKERTDTLTAGQVIQLKGKSLQTHDEDAQEGVFLIDSKGKETRLSLFRNKPSELLLKVPEGLPAGAYKLEVRSWMKSKTLRKGTYPKSVMVA